MNRPILVCLHGWGGSAASFDPLRHELEGSLFDILTPNLPGFGGEPDPPKPWHIDDYVAWVEAYIKRERPNTHQFFLLGHSHGGRIAIKFSLKHPHNIRCLTLCAAAGIRSRRHAKRLLGLTLAKMGKMLFSLPLICKLAPLGKRLLYKLVRVHDYERASTVMKETLVLVTEEDLRPLLADIKVPTDIFWGENDTMTPIGDAHIMHTAIQGSILHTYPGVRHAVHKDRAREIAQSLRSKISS